MIKRLLGAYFSPLRDPYQKDWLFYVFLFFTIPQIISHLSTGVASFIVLSLSTLFINWLIIIFGISWIRSFGTNKYSIGISPGYKSAESGNFPVVRSSGEKLHKQDLQDLLNEFKLSAGNSMDKNFGTQSPDWSAHIEADFIWVALDMHSTLSSMIYGPIWFSCSEVKGKVPANLSLTHTGEIGISWRKHKNSLLDYWITHISEIKSYQLIAINVLKIEFGTVNRCIGNVSGLRRSEVATIEIRVSRDGQANRRALTVFGSFIENLKLDPNRP
jgi:hypothetical protein